MLNSLQSQDTDDERERSGKRSSFGGESSKKADKGPLNKAEQMLANGIDREKIRQQTGWFIGSDGLWRYEIDDSNMEFNQMGFGVREDHLEYERLEGKRKIEILSANEKERLNELRKIYENKPLLLKDFLKHEELFSAYPILKNIRVKFIYEPANLGQFDIKENAMYVNPRLIRKRQQSIIVHELQHAIQFIEGFAQGSDTELFEEVELPEKHRKLYDRLTSLEDSLTEKLKKEGYDYADHEKNDKIYAFKSDYIDENIEVLEKLAKRNMKLKGELKEYNELKDAFALYRKFTPRGKYFRTAGEIEARDAAARQKMSAEKRRNTRPDIDRGDEVLVAGIESNRVQIFDKAEADIYAAHGDNGRRSSLGGVDNYTEEEYNKEQPIYTPREDWKNRKPLDFRALRETQKKTDLRLGLNKEQARALSDYVLGRMAYVLNSRLNAKDKTTSESKTSKYIAEALEKFPVYEGVTYRNLYFNDKTKYNEFFEKNSLGKEVTLDAFTSTSKVPNGYRKNLGNEVHMVFEGYSDRDIADTYGQPHQQEVIYLPGTKYIVTQITKANDNRPLLFVKEIRQNEIQVDDGNTQRRKPYNRRDGAPAGRISEGKGVNMGRVYGDGRRSADDGVGRAEVLERRLGINSDSDSSQDSGRRSSLKNEGQLAKANAEYKNVKVYNKKDATECIDSIKSAAHIRGKKREDLVNLLWSDMNTVVKTKAQREKNIKLAATNLANKIAELSADIFSVQESTERKMLDAEVYKAVEKMFAEGGHISQRIRIEQQYRTEQEMRSYRQDEERPAYYTTGDAERTLESIHGYENIPKGERSKILNELALGLNRITDKTTQIEFVRQFSDRLFFMIVTDNQYKEMTQQEHTNVKREIVDALLTTIKEGGAVSAARKNNIDYYRRKLKNTIEWFKATLALDRTVRSIRDKKFGTIYDNATEYKSTELKALLKDLSKFEFRKTFSSSRLREKLSELSSWYNKENTMLLYRKSDDPSLQDDTGLYYDGIKSSIDSLAGNKGAFTVEELRSLDGLLSYFVHFLDNYEYVFIDGKLIFTLFRFDKIRC